MQICGPIFFSIITMTFNLKLPESSGSFFGSASSVGVGCMFRSSKVFLGLGVGHPSFTNLESSESSSWCEIGIFPRNKPT